MSHDLSMAVEHGAEREVEPTQGLPTSALVCIFARGPFTAVNDLIGKLGHATCCELTKPE